MTHEHLGLELTHNFNCYADSNQQGGSCEGQLNLCNCEGNGRQKREEREEECAEEKDATIDLRDVFSGGLALAYAGDHAVYGLH